MINPNLFNIFDPSTSIYFSLNWLSLSLPILTIPYIYWAFPSRTQILILFMSTYISKELKNNLTNLNFKSLNLLFTIFWFILIRNLIGLYPYIFTATRHLLITLSIALPFWLLFIIYGWVNLTSHIFTHLVPIGSPLILRFFIVFIETISNVIRPITLSVRLTANIIAGHLLINLLRSIRENSPNIFIPTYFIIFLLLILETAVAIVQSYVFVTLTSLYLSEIN
jgi:F-type H+-transporting ATPase subunit a